MVFMLVSTLIAMSIKLTDFYRSGQHLLLVLGTDAVDDRRDALRALLARDSAMDWMARVGGSVATRAVREDSEHEAKAASAPESAPTTSATAPKAPPPAPKPDRSQVAKRSEKSSSRRAARPKLTKESKEDQDDLRELESALVLK